MNWLSLMIIAVLGGLLFLTLIALTLAIVGNLKTGMAFRRHLAKQLHRLRLEKMLKALGMDPDRYLAKVPVTVIDAQMRACEDCTPPAKERCEEQLGQERLEDPSFCPNYPKLKSLKEETAESGHAT